MLAGPIFSKEKPGSVIFTYKQALTLTRWARKTWLFVEVLNDGFLFFRLTHDNQFDVDRDVSIQTLIAGPHHRWGRLDKGWAGGGAGGRGGAGGGRGGGEAEAISLVRYRVKLQLNVCKSRRRHRRHKE